MSARVVIELLIKLNDGGTAHETMEGLAVVVRLHPRAEGETMRFITRVIYEWGARAFGLNHMHDRHVRALRLMEEAVELAQACDVSRVNAMQLVSMVYDRPPGDIRQEIGGVLVTAHAFCAGQGIEVEKALEDEVCRVLDYSPDHFAKRNQTKIDMGLK